MKTILFDLDGTIINSAPGILHCVRHAYNTLSLEAPEEAILRTFIGPPLRDSFVRHGVPAAQAQEAVAVFQAEYQRTGKYQVTPYPGIENMLAILQRRGFSLCIATSKPEVMATDILARLGFSQYFDHICGATMDATRETKAQVIDYLLSQSGGAKNAIMVGDTDYDVIGAAAHGIPTIGVAWGFGSEEQMRKAGAITVVHTAEELYSFMISR